MDEQQLRKRMAELDKEGRLKVEHQRFCMKADKEGLKKIIQENSKISCIKVIPRPHGLLEFNGCDEYFYSTDDEEFNKFAREKILKEIVLFKEGGKDESHSKLR